MAGDPFLRRVWGAARRVEDGCQVLRLDVQDQVLAGCPGGAGPGCQVGRAGGGGGGRARRCGRRGSVAGQAALLLAGRVESGRDGGSAVAALVRQLGLTMEAALAGGRVAHSPLEQMRAELAERRRSRATGAGA